MLKPTSLDVCVVCDGPFKMGQNHACPSGIIFELNQSEIRSSLDSETIKLSLTERLSIGFQMMSDGFIAS